MSMLDFAFFYLTMFLAASIFSAFGVGGGVIYTPVQLLFGIEFHEAAATSLFLIMITSLSATLVFRKAASVDWPLAIVLESVTAFGAFLGGVYSGYFSATFLTYLLAYVLAIASFFMIKKLRGTGGRSGQHSDFFHWRRNIGSKTYYVNLGLALPVAFAVGAVSGLVGISGGILKVPMLVLLFGVPMNIAIGSSAFMVGLTASGGFVGHLAAGHFNWRTALALAPAIFIGAQIGARTSIKVEKGKMRRAFGYLLAALALFLIARTVIH